jgi:hypothetical protein
MIILRIFGELADRMKLTFLPKPKVVSNLKDSLGIVENRRAEILCDDWELCNLCSINILKLSLNQIQ